MKNYTDSFEETMRERQDRIDSMLKCMLVEASVYALSNNEALPTFSRNEIAKFCGCSKDYIRRIEERALSNVREVMSQ
jgi:hypothetical protein